MIKSTYVYESKKKVNFIIQRWFLVIRAIVLVGRRRMDRSIDRHFRLEERRLRHNGSRKGLRLSVYSVALMGRARWWNNRRFWRNRNGCFCRQLIRLDYNVQMSHFFFFSLSLPFFFGLVSSRCVKGCCALYRCRQIHLGIFPLENDIYWLVGRGWVEDKGRLMVLMVTSWRICFATVEIVIFVKI